MGPISDISLIEGLIKLLKLELNTPVRIEILSKNNSSWRKE